eukprot:jgi/Mesvir1/582/Mv02026-RA.1
MGKGEEEAAALQCVVKWVNTFPLGTSRACRDIDDLRDGLVFFQILSQVAPSYVDPFFDTSGGQLLGAGDDSDQVLEALARGIESYFREEPMGAMEASEARPDVYCMKTSLTPIINTAERILKICLESGDREHYIQTIMQMDNYTQSHIMRLIQNIEVRLHGLEGEQSDRGSENLAGEGEADAYGIGTGLPTTPMRVSTPLRSPMIRSPSIFNDDDGDPGREWLAELDHSRAGDVSISSAGGGAHVSYRQQLLRLGAERDKYLKQYDALLARYQLVEKMNEQLTNEKKEMTKEMTRLAAEKSAEQPRLHEYEAKLEEKEARIVEMTAQAAELPRLQAELRRQQDELDVLRAQVAAAESAERTLDQYKRKLEGVAELKRAVAELEEQNGRYLQQVLALEQEAHKMPVLLGQVEHYREESSRNNARAMAATAEATSLRRDVSRLKKQLEEAALATERAEAKAEGFRVKMEALEQSGGAGGGADRSLGLAVEEAMGLAEAKQRLLRLEAENAQLRKGRDDGSSAGGLMDVVRRQLEDALAAQRAAEQGLEAAEGRAGEAEVAAEELRERLKQLEAAHASATSELLRRRTEEPILLDKLRRAEEGLADVKEQLASSQRAEQLAAQECAALQKALSMHEAGLNASGDEIVGLKAEMARLAESRRSADQSKAELLDQIRAAQADAHAARGDALSALSDLERSQRQLAESQAALERALERASGAEAKCMAAVEAHKAEVLQLREELMVARVAVREEAGSALASARAEVLALKEQLFARATEARDGESAREVALRQQLVALQEELASARADAGAELERARSAAFELKERLLAVKQGHADELAAVTKQAEARAAELEAEEARTAMEADLTALRSRVPELDAELRFSKEARKGVEEELVGLRSRVPELEGQVASGREARGALEAQLADVREALAAAQQGLEAARAVPVDTHSRGRDEDEEAVREMAGALEAARSEAGWLQKDLSKVRDELSRAQEDLARALKDVAKAQEEVARAEGDAARLREEVARAQQEYARGKEEAVRAQEECARLREEVGKVREGAEGLGAQLATRTGERDAERKAREDAEAARDKAKERVHELKEQLLEAKEAITVREDLVRRSMAAELASAKQESLGLKEQMLAMREEMLARDGTGVRATATAEAVAVELSSAKSDLAACKQELAACKQELVEARADLATSKSELAVARSEVASLKSEVTAGKAEAAALRAAVDSATREREEASLLVAATRRAVDDKDVALSSALAERERLQARLAEAKDGEEARQQEVVALREKMLALKEELFAASMAAREGESAVLASVRAECLQLREQLLVAKAREEEVARAAREREEELVRGAREAEERSARKAKEREEELARSAREREEESVRRAREEAAARRAKEEEGAAALSRDASMSGAVEAAQREAAQLRAELDRCTAELKELLREKSTWGDRLLEAERAKAEGERKIAELTAAVASADREAARLEAQLDKADRQRQDLVDKLQAKALAATQLEEQLAGKEQLLAEREGGWRRDAAEREKQLSALEVRLRDVQEEARRETARVEALMGSKVTEREEQCRELQRRLAEEETARKAAAEALHALQLQEAGGIPVMERQAQEIRKRDDEIAELEAQLRKQEHYLRAAKTHIDEMELKRREDKERENERLDERIKELWQSEKDIIEKRISQQDNEIVRLRKSKEEAKAMADREIKMLSSAFFDAVVELQRRTVQERRTAAAVGPVMQEQQKSVLLASLRKGMYTPGTMTPASTGMMTPPLPMTPRTASAIPGEYPPGL